VGGHRPQSGLDLGHHLSGHHLRGTFFYLYLILDIYSRKIVGWEVYPEESTEHAASALRARPPARGLSGSPIWSCTPTTAPP
jgi:transposase InsO family protein